MEYGCHMLMQLSLRLYGNLNQVFKGKILKTLFIAFGAETTLHLT